MDKEKLLKRIAELKELGKAVLATSSKINSLYYVDFGKSFGFRSSCLSFIKNSLGDKNTYYQEFNDVVSGQDTERFEAGLEILNSIEKEIEDGWLFSVKTLVEGEVFSDFLEMAEHLLENKYKDAAAVIIGSVLEEKLRTLCNKNGLPITYEKDDKQIPKKADLMNSDLVKSDVYGKLDQKQVTTWLDLRNNAAHGKYDEYQIEQVRLMLQGVLDFINRLSL